jgi:hypothetical protein
MSAGSLSRAAWTLAGVCIATGAGVAYIHRGQRLEREVRTAGVQRATHDARRRRAHACTHTRPLHVHAARCAGWRRRDNGAGVFRSLMTLPRRMERCVTRVPVCVRVRCCRTAQALHAGVLRDEARLAAKRAERAAERAQA